MSAGIDILWGIIVNRLMLMLLGLAVLASAIPASAAMTNVSTLVVQGEGKVYAAPDMAVIVLGVETRNIKADVAARDNAEMMNRTIQALIGAGVMQENIQTSHYSLSTQTEDENVPVSDAVIRTRNTTPVFVATNQVTAMMGADEDVGKVLDTAVAAGSNSIQSVSFELKNSTASNDAALKEAVRDAQRKAGVLSTASGIRLGPITEISGGYSYTSSSEARFSLAAAAPTPIQPGQMEVTASVSITYLIYQ
jgi:uncharacterized protein